MSIARQIIPVLVLPTNAVAVIPGLALWATDSLGVGWSLPAPARAIVVGVGCMLVACGVYLGARTLLLFATAGEGTPAPWDPPRKLVVRGMYGHVRNPMISGVFLALIGETAVTGSLAVLAWCVIFICGNLLYISLESKRAPAAKQAMVRRVGIAIAVVARIALLFVLTRLIGFVQDPIFEVNLSGFVEGSFNLHSLIVLVGGVFIIYTATKEIFHMMNLCPRSARATPTVAKSSSVRGVNLM